MEVGRLQARGAHDGDRRVVQRPYQRGDDVVLRDASRIQHHDDLAGGTTEGGLQRISGTERDGGGDDLIGRSHDGDAGPGDHHDLGVRGSGARKRVEDGVRRCVFGDDDDRGRGRGGFVEPRRDRVDRAVERAFAVGHVGRPGRLQVVAGSEVDDLPAGRFDARLELVGGAVVAPDTSGCSLVGERDDLVGY